MDEVSFSGLVIILSLGSLVPQYVRCNSCKVSLMKTTAHIGIFWRVLMLHPSIFGCIYASQPGSIHLLSSDFCPLACESGCRAWLMKMQSGSLPFLWFCGHLFTNKSCWKMNEPGSRRAVLPSLPSLSRFLARAQALPFLVSWLVTVHLTCLLSSPGFFGLCSKQCLCCCAA